MQLTCTWSHEQGCVSLPLVPIYGPSCFLLIISSVSPSRVSWLCSRCPLLVLSIYSVFFPVFPVGCYTCLFHALCVLPAVWDPLKFVILRIWFSCFLVLRHRRSLTEQPNETKSEQSHFFPLFVFHFFHFFFFFFPPAEVPACIFALSRRDLPFYEYAGEFCRLATGTALDDAAINHLFWLGANYHRPVDLPDTTGLSWRGDLPVSGKCPGQNQPIVHGSPHPLSVGQSAPESGPGAAESSSN